MLEKMRREKQALDEAEIEQILARGASGVLALMDKDGYPYAVPLSYVYVDGKIYFHSAKTGHKIDAVRFCDKASFCVIDKDDVRPKKYTTFYKSVIAFGKAEIVQSEEETLSAMRALGEKYYPNHDEALEVELAKFKSAFAVIKFSIEHITGKQARELIAKQ